MKKLILLSFFLLTVTAFAKKTPYLIILSDTLYYNWETKNYPMIDNADVNLQGKIYNNGDFWIGGLIYGTFAHISEDNLESWHKVPYTTPSMYMLDFVLLNKNKVIAIGDSQDVNYKSKKGFVFISNDTLKTWEKIGFENEKLIHMQSMAFVDNDNGIISGLSEGNSKLFRTEDGGESWRLLKSLSEFCSGDTIIVYQLYQSKESHVIMAGVYDLSTNKEFFMFTTDLGENWTGPRELPIKNLGTGISSTSKVGFYARKDSVWITTTIGDGHGEVDGLSAIFFTSDLGKTWQTQYLSHISNGYEYIFSIQFFDNSLVGFACEVSPRVFFTFDGGNHWAQILDSITYYGINGSDLDHKDTNWVNICKTQVVKSSRNKMVFFGRNKAFIFNNLNIPKGVEEAEEEKIYCAYDSRAQAIVVDAKQEGAIDKITLYDEAANRLYEQGSAQGSIAQIPKSCLGSAKVVFALIGINGEIHIKKLMCE